MIEIQISLLIKLARQDGTIDAKEKELIYKIGTSHGLENEKIENLINLPQDVNPQSLTADESFECLHNLVHLMKVDGQIFDEEIRYCMDMARKLGYPLQAVMELYGLVHANVRLTSEINALKNKYLKK